MGARLNPRFYSLEYAKAARLYTSISKGLTFGFDRQWDRFFPETSQTMGVDSGRLSRDS
jgi:hypothetical protein